MFGANTMLDIFGLEDNVVSNDLTGYSFMFMSEDSGDGKTYTTNMMLRTLTDDGRVPLYIATEDRYQGIPGIRAVRVRNLSDVENVKNQLLNPKAKEIYSCLVVDTLEQLEELIGDFVTTSKGVEITDELQFGKGNKYMKSKTKFINELENNGWTIHYITQCRKKEDIIKQTVEFSPKANKDIYHRIKTQVYCSFMLSKNKVTGDRTLTCEPNQKYPELKNGLGLPRTIKPENFKQELEKALVKISGGKLTDKKTVNLVVERDSFDKIKSDVKDLGQLLYEKGAGQEVSFILGQVIGVDDNKQPLSYTSLSEGQRDTMELLRTKLVELKNSKGL